MSKDAIICQNNLEGIVSGELKPILRPATILPMISWREKLTLGWFQWTGIWAGKKLPLADRLSTQTLLSKSLITQCQLIKIKLTRQKTTSGTGLNPYQPKILCWLRWENLVWIHPVVMVTTEKRTLYSMCWETMRPNWWKRIIVPTAKAISVGLLHKLILTKLLLYTLRHHRTVLTRTCKTQRDLNSLLICQVDQWQANWGIIAQPTTVACCSQNKVYV